MRALFGFALATALLAGGLPAEVEAQGRGKAKNERVERRGEECVRVAGRVVCREADERRADRNTRAVSKREGKGPKFCRNGSGHPVHGREWCRDKGFGLGNEGWRRAGWEDVIFRRPGDGRATVSSRTLGDILGDVVFGRLVDQRRRAGFDGPLTGYWDTGTRERVLHVRAGDAPLARFVDANRDGRVDVILLSR